MDKYDTHTFNVKNETTKTAPAKSTQNYGHLRLAIECNYIASSQSYLYSPKFVITLHYITYNTHGLDEAP